MGSGDFFRAVSKTKSNFCDYTEKKGEINPIDNEKINNNVLPFVQSVLNNPDSQSSVQKAVMTVSETNESFHLIPINSDDEEVLAFIIKYELQDPCKLFKFLIELYFASFESLAESINFVLVQDRDNIIGTIKDLQIKVKT